MTAHARALARPHRIAFAPLQWEPVVIGPDGREVSFPVWSADRWRALAAARWLAAREGWAVMEEAIQLDLWEPHTFGEKAAARPNPTDAEMPPIPKAKPVAGGH